MGKSESHDKKIGNPNRKPKGARGNAGTATQIANAFGVRNPQHKVLGRDGKPIN